VLALKTIRKLLLLTLQNGFKLHKKFFERLLRRLLDNRICSVGSAAGAAGVPQGAGVHLWVA